MKKFTKISLIVVGVLLAAGVVLTAVANGLAGGSGALHEMVRNGDLNFGNWVVGEHGVYYTYKDIRNYGWNRDREEADLPDAPNAPDAPERAEAAGDGETTYRFALTDVRNLDMELDIAELTVREGSSSDEIVVTLTEGDDRCFSAKVDGGTMHIDYDFEDEDGWLIGWNWGWNFNTPDVRIAIEIPSGTYFERLKLETGAASVHFDTDSIRCGKLEVDAGVGDIVMTGLMVDERMEVEAGTGNVEISGDIYGDVKADCGVGNFELKGLVQGNITAECGMGNMELSLKGKETDYNYRISCGMGSVSVNGMEYNGVDWESNIANEGAVGTIDVDCGMGSVSLRFTE